MKKIMIFILIFLLEAFFCSAISINEIMYNPEGSDNNNEFVEIYFDNGQANLTGWTISDSESNDTLNLLWWVNGSSYALIVEEGYNFANINATIYSAGASIGNNLGNSADEIHLYDNDSNLIASASYDGSMANGNGFSMEYSGNWQECNIGGSPGEENCISDLNSTVNETSQTNSTPVNSTECRPVIVVYTDKEIYNDTDKVNIYFALYNDSFPYTIEYWIEDSAGNIVKSRYNTTNTNKKSWTPRLEERDRVFYVKANLYLQCGNETKEGSSESMFIVFGDNTNKKSESEIVIREVYLGSDEKTEFGQPLRINLEVYKGDETKNTVELWVEGSEKISQTTKALFYDKFTEYDTTLPIQLKPNCNKKYKDGAYTIIAEGLGQRIEEKVDIEGITDSLCEKSSSGSLSSSAASGTSETYSSAAEKTKVNYQLLNFNSEIEPEKEIINELLIQNDHETRIFDVWSYVYRGSKSYSGEREENKQSLELLPYESAIVELKNIVYAEPGDYKLKVKIKKDSQKTNHEITKEVKVIENNEPDNAEKAGVNEGIRDIKNSMEKATGSVVYGGSAAKSKKLSPILILASIFLISLIGLRSLIKKVKKPEKTAKIKAKIKKKAHHKL